MTEGAKLLKPHIVKRYFLGTLGFSLVAMLFLVTLSIPLTLAGDNTNEDSIVIATDSNYPDAVLGSVLAREKNIPIILVKDEDHARELLEGYSDVKRSYVIGREAAVSFEIEDIFSEKWDVVRIGGEDRGETSKLLARYINKEPIRVPDSFYNLLVASNLDRPILIDDSAPFELDFKDTIGIANQLVVIDDLDIEAISLVTALNGKILVVDELNKGTLNDVRFRYGIAPVIMEDIEGFDYISDEKLEDINELKSRGESPVGVYLSPEGDLFEPSILSNPTTGKPSYNIGDKVRVFWTVRAGSRPPNYVVVEFYNEGEGATEELAALSSSTPSYDGHTVETTEAGDTVRVYIYYADDASDHHGDPGTRGEISITYTVAAVPEFPIPLGTIIMIGVVASIYFLLRKKILPSVTSPLYRAAH